MVNRDLAQTTLILSKAAQGDPAAADKLTPLVYDNLRHLAGNYLRRERPDHTLQPTALVHEAYLNLVDRTAVSWEGRTHFLAVAANEMRRVLVHHARKRHAHKRGRGWVRIPLDAALLRGTTGEVDFLDLEDALAELSSQYPRQGQVVELRFFSGLTVEEVAHALGVAAKTVEKDWRMARAWLHRHFTRAEAAQNSGVDRDKSST